MPHFHMPPRKAADVELCDRVKTLRDKMGITQADMGKMLGVAAITIRKWESRERTPTRLNPFRCWLRRRIAQLEAVAANVDMRDRTEPPSFNLKAKRRQPIEIDG